MARRDRDNKKSGDFDYCIMEVRLKKKGVADAKEDCRFMIVDSRWDTLNFVQEHMEQCVGNIVKLKRMDERQAKKAQDSAALFQRTLAPLVTSLAAGRGEGVMDKLSASLKKALLLMVMTRYQSDREQACKVLGISQEKLENELKLCGVPQ